jgi:hypothetical protein
MLLPIKLKFLIKVFKLTNLKKYINSNNSKIKLKQFQVLSNSKSKINKMLPILIDLKLIPSKNRLFNKIVHLNESINNKCKIYKKILKSKTLKNLKT